MKKITAILLICFVLVNVSIVFANSDTVQMNSVLEQIKPRIPSTDEYDEFSSTVSTVNGSRQYRFSWTKNDIENSTYTSMTVRANSNGVILSYDYYDDGIYKTDNQASINRISSDDALKTAEDMIKKINPEISQKLVISKAVQTESLYEREFNFNVQRYENSIPVIGNSGNITLSSDAKTLLSFYINYEDMIFLDNEIFITREDAVESFYKNFGMKLKYADNYSSGEKEIVLQYEPDFADGTYMNEYVSAVDGSIVKRQEENELYRFSALDSTLNTAEKSASGGFSILTETEIKEIEKMSNLLNIKEAESIVRSNKIIGLNDKYMLSESRLNRDYEDKYIYNLMFELSGEENEDFRVYTVNTFIDASNGKIIRFYKNGKYSDEKNISDDEALKKADEAVRTLAPEYFDETPDFFLDEKEFYNGNYTYKRFVNGIVYDYNEVNVSVNLSDGSINSYLVNYGEYEFPSADGIISDKEACLKLFDQIDYSVKYLPLIREENEATAVPVYASQTNSLVTDAFSGMLIFSEDENTLEPYSDIKGHYAETAVNTLAKFGIGFEGGIFKPDENINQKDFLALLSAAFTYRHPVVIKDSFDYSYFYSSAKHNGIIKEGEYNPEKEITRMDSAIMLVRAIGAEDIAELNDIFVPIFSDVTEKWGYTSILGAMNVIKGDESKRFNPDQNLTRADALVMLYNYLSK